MLEHSDCRALVTTAPLATGTPAFGRVRQLILLDDEVPPDFGRSDARSWTELLATQPNQLPDLAPDQPTVLMYTSGTTGTPKGVPLTHRNLCANLRALEAADLAQPVDRVLLPLPLHHAYPLTVGLLAPLAIGAAVVLPAGITGPQIMRALRDQRCTIMIAVPRLYEAMLAGIERQIAGAPRLIGGALRGLLEFAVWVRRRLGRRIGKALFLPLHRRIGPALRLLASGGARLDPEVAWRLEGLGWEVLTGYGLTETAPILTFNPPGRARIESVGLPVEGVELRLGPAEDAQPGHGEILAKGPNVFSGYWDNPEATAQAFTADGFFRTGDLGRFDDAGYLYIVGRSKELIILSGGENIFPEEVEAVYGTAAQAREVAVLERDDRLVALFVPDPEALRASSQAELHQHFRREVERRSPQLPSYARIGDFAITRQPLPRTQIGKLRRHELAEIFVQEKAGAGRPEPQAAVTGADRALLERPLADRIWRWLEERFAGHALTLDTSPQLDLGLNSFDWMSLTMELDERFGVRLSEDAVARVNTLRDLLVEAREASETAPHAEIGQPTPEQERLLAPRGPIQEPCARPAHPQPLALSDDVPAAGRGPRASAEGGAISDGPQPRELLRSVRDRRGAAVAASPAPVLGRLGRPLVPRPVHASVQPCLPGAAGRSGARPDVDPDARPGGAAARRSPGLVPRGPALDRRPAAALPARRRAAARADRRAGGAGVDRGHLRGVAAGAAAAAAVSGEHPLRAAADARRSRSGGRRRRRHRRIAERLRAKVAALGPDDGGPAAVRLAG